MALTALAAILVGGHTEAASLAAQCDNTLPNNQTCPEGHGPFFYADPDHCSMYWQCDEGCSSHLLCQKDYLYDDLHKWCNFPKDVSCGDRDCDGRPCKPNPPPINFTCPADNGLFPDDHNCIKYYQCYEGVPEEKICQVKDNKQLLYDPDHQWCDWPDRVKCGGRPVCDKDDKNCGTQPTPAPTTPGTTHPPNTCDTFGACYKPGEMRSEGECKNCFCECASSKWTQLCCQPGLVFNPVSSQCDWPYNNPDCK